MPEDGSFSRLSRTLGRNSRYAGIAFIGLSVVFLVLSVSDQFIVFEVDSIVAFLAAVVLLFKDPSARVQAGVLDAILTSSDRVITELAAPLGQFTYKETGTGVEGVEVVPSDFAPAPGLNAPPAEAPPLTFTPPGRALAVLYTREAGLNEVTMEALKASLSEMMRERFGLARSVDIEFREDLVKVTLHGASATCTCRVGQTERTEGGAMGCTLASFLAVLFTTATKRVLSLEPCQHDTGADTWTVSMRLSPMLAVKV